MSKAALCATSTAPSVKARNRGSTLSTVGASATIASSMWWMRVEAAGMRRPGLISWLNTSPRSTRPLTMRTPATEIIRSPREGSSPVVSVSNTTKSSARSGVSSMRPGSTRLIRSKS